MVTSMIGYDKKQSDAYLAKLNAEYDAKASGLKERINMLGKQREELLDIFNKLKSRIQAESRKENIIWLAERRVEK